MKRSCLIGLLAIALILLVSSVAFANASRTGAELDRMCIDNLELKSTLTAKEK